MSDSERPQPNQQQQPQHKQNPELSSTSTESSPKPPLASGGPSSSSTSESSAPAIIETTTDYSPNRKPPLAVEEDTNSTASSNIPAVTVTAIENPQPAQLTTICPSVGPVESTVTATVHQASLPAAAIIIERQVSVSSTEGNMSHSGNGGSGFRSSFNGRVPFARILSSGSSSDRRSGNAGAENNRSNMSMLNDIFAMFQQTRLVTQRRHNLFLPGAQAHAIAASHMPGTSTPPVGNPSDVVIDLDNGVTTGPSPRSSNNEIYPISASSSIASFIRPNSWIQNNPTEDDGPGAVRASVMPNFNYHHHHHHFHNHQPLSSNNHQHLSQLQQSGPGSTNQPSSLGAATSSGIPGEPSNGPQLSSPTNPDNPSNINNGTRSNSVSSNQQPAPNDEAAAHETANQIPEADAMMSAMMDAIARYIPLLFILVTKLCYDHLDGIIHFLALLMTFSHANWVVRQEVSKQAQKRIVVLFRELLFISIALAVVGFVLERKNIFLSILFMPDLSEPQTLKSLLFSVCISDLVLKLLTIFVKLLITLMPPSVIEYKSRGKIYLMTESLSQLYRAAAPIQPWLIFLFESYSGSEKIVGVILSAVYMVAKSSDLLDRIKFCKRSVIKLLQKTSYGTIPSKEQLQACGGQCPICHDNFNSPVLLECNHIFCELCVGTWFDREQTCPLCRAKIVDDPSYRDGATTFFLQLY
ncbi:E3 ubiquitin-protein ligase RNFT1 [Uranotaenia lowii]|uniref:E3 ubiquitin-protein ligase RNFT1 n=1 Tax=Uranotaenia lowii TaxID=190385 RepID=UPI00247952C8|nr:E3 ubiquitin-protein ligase RNFT1 [Uranotaenia lowii]